MVTEHKIGTRDEWKAAREALLEREKEMEPRRWRSSSTAGRNCSSITSCSDWTTRLAARCAHRAPIPWVSSYESDFDFGVSAPKEKVAPMLESGVPPILEELAAECGTDPAGYMTEQQALTAFALEDGVVYHTYSTFARGVEIIMGFYPLLDRAPKWRNESDDSEFWIRRHDEYEDLARR